MVFSIMLNESISLNRPVARKKAVHPIGEWNTIEIVSKDGQVRSYLNGILVSTVSHHEYTEPGYIGFQSEGAKIYWRNISIKEE